MQSEPAITVAMSMRNASRYLRECIDSVLVQSHADFEFLIVDDGSTDGSADIVRSYSDPRIRLICRHHDFIASLNTLLSEARGRYIARMDADDIMMPDRLKRQFDYLEAHPEVAAVAAGAVRIDQAGNPIGRITTGSHEPVAVTLRRMCEYNMVCNPASMIRRAAIDRIGLRYDPTYRVASDYRFWCDLLLSGAAIHILPFDAIRYRISPGQISTARSDESNAAARRIRRELKATLVEKANPGYHDPIIGDSDRELTLIIPFLNEGEEVENTVRSFLHHGGAGKVDVIVINDCSYDSYPYMERISSIPGVTYILNRERLGVAASRDKGVSLCHTPYFLLLDAHMRAYDDLWTTEIPRLLRENDRRILCCQTRVLTYNESGCIMAQDYRTFFGARLTFTTKLPVPGIEWINEEQDPTAKYEVIPAILGAGYGISKRYWNHINGLRGLVQYGSDEQMLSLKTWLEGGVCVLLKKIVLGHIYRSQMPYSYEPIVSLQNSLVISETLFPLRDKCKARAFAFSAYPQAFVSAFSECKKIIGTDPKISNWCESSITRDIEIIKHINRNTSSLEKNLQKNVENRLQDIANLILNTNAPNAGIYEGKAAYAIWMFHYAKYCNNNGIYRYALNFLDEAIQECDFTDFSFKSGLTGIGWAIWYLLSTRMIETLPKAIKNINLSISEHVNKVTPITDNLSFSNGLGGVLAYYCIKPSKDIKPSLITKLNQTASIILTSKRKTTGTEAFYAFMWQELNRESNIRDIPQWGLSDWVILNRLLVKDSRFWKLSLYDGVLATSISFL